MKREALKKDERERGKTRKGKEAHNLVYLPRSGERKEMREERARDEVEIHYPF